MFIFKSSTGWGASNEAYIEDKKTPLYEDGKLIRMESHKECVVTSTYAVSGSLDGKVKIAIKDDVSGDVSCFDGECITPNRIRITAWCDNSWLKSIK